MTNDEGNPNDKQRRRNPVIMSEVEGSPRVTVSARNGIPRLRFAALGMTGI